MRHRLESVPGYGNKLAPAHIMQTGDRVLLIFFASAACCLVLPFAPEEVRAWIFRGPGWFIVLSGILGAIAWTIWKSE